MAEPTKILYGNEPGIAKQGVYRNIQWYIVRGHICPLAYIVIPRHKLKLKSKDLSFDDYPHFKNCHGGLTYCNTSVKISKDITIEPSNSIIFGWDYGHWMDYTKYTGGINGLLNVWSVAEIEKEVELTIDDYYTYYCK